MSYIPLEEKLEANCSEFSEKLYIKHKFLLYFQQNRIMNPFEIDDILIKFIFP